MHQLRARMSRHPLRLGTRKLFSNIPTPFGQRPWWPAGSTDEPGRVAVPSMGQVGQEPASADGIHRGRAFSYRVVRSRSEDKRED